MLGLQMRSSNVARSLDGARLRSKATTRVAPVAAAQKDVLLRSISDMGEVAVLVVDSTQLVSEAQRRHKTAPTATAALGRSLTGALLMGAFRKEQEMVQVNFQGDGPLGGCLCVADTKGNVRGKVGNPAADPPLYENGKLNVGAAVGGGILSVVRSHPLQPNPYTGMTQIVSGEIAEDLANYLVESEQTNSAIALGVTLDRECAVKAAGGFLVQVLPFCSEETLEILEKNLAGITSVSQMLCDGMTPETITERLLDGLGVSPGAEIINPAYGPCCADTLRARMEKAVASLGEEEIRAIQAEQGKIEVTCDFCVETFVLEEEALLAMAKGASA